MAALRRAWATNVTAKLITSNSDDVRHISKKAPRSPAWVLSISRSSGRTIFNTPTKLMLLGGLEVGQNTLLRFYVLHVIVLPLIAAIFLAVHFWRIRKDGGISGPL